MHNSVRIKLYWCTSIVQWAIESGVLGCNQKTKVFMIHDGILNCCCTSRSVLNLIFFSHLNWTDKTNKHYNYPHLNFSDLISPRFAKAERVVMSLLHTTNKPVTSAVQSKNTVICSCNITHTSIKRTISCQSTPMVKSGVDIGFIWVDTAFNCWRAYRLLVSSGISQGKKK